MMIAGEYTSSISGQLVVILQAIIACLQTIVLILTRKK